MGTDDRARIAPPYEARDKRKRKDHDVKGCGYRIKAKRPGCSSQELPMVNEREKRKHQPSRVA